MLFVGRVGSVRNYDGALNEFYLTNEPRDNLESLSMSITVRALKTEYCKRRRGVRKLKTKLAVLTRVFYTSQNPVI